MLLFLLLLVLFWAVVPGLIAGWMLHERGRSFGRGLLVGALCGPLGILATLAFIYFSDRRIARTRKHGRGRAFRVFYDVPVVGRLHVSTVWALAGLATFLCAWMIGGIVYEVYWTDRGETLDARDATAGLQSGSKSRSGQAAHAGEPAADPKQPMPAQSNTSSQARTSLMGNIAAQPSQPGGARADNSSTQPGQPATPAGTDASTVAPRPAPGAPEASAGVGGTANAPTPAPTAKAPAQGRESAVAEVTQSLAARGHRVHASVSGDAQTSTLSLSGATLTREAGNQILGNARLRQALKSVGVRIVVMVNGQESWTYML
jgi:hypothetical protein